jgi:hypothetical protein
MLITQPANLTGRSYLRSSYAFGLKVSVLYLLCGSLALYPLLNQFIAPVLGASFAMATIIVLIGISSRQISVPKTFIWQIWATLSIVYITWIFVAIVRGNYFPYVILDSQGFLLYMGAMPVICLLVVHNHLQANFIRFIDYCSLTIAGASLLLAVGFFIVLGGIDAESIFVINAFLASLGLYWTIDHNFYFLGLYTNTAHLLLLGMALSLYRYQQQHRHRDILLVLIFLAGIVLDGRRALVIAALIQLMIVAPSMLAAVPRRQRQLLLFVTTSIIVAVGISSFDWIVERFVFSEDDASSATRYAQIPALLAKIFENPIIGGGFGTVADHIRSIERPFSYEVDILATIMKLGVVGSLLYFGAYLYGLAQAKKLGTKLGIFLLSPGIAFLFYMGTNGNQAMSTDSAVFHIFLFLLIAFAHEGRILQCQPCRAQLEMRPLMPTSSK